MDIDTKTYRSIIDKFTTTSLGPMTKGLHSTYYAAMPIVLENEQSDKHVI
jgi:hypothetical protein